MAIKNSSHEAGSHGIRSITTAPILHRYDAQRANRAHRPFNPGAIIAAVIRAAGAIARRAQARLWQRRHTRNTYDALHRLDDRMLRDLGFVRSELRSVAEEVTAKAECARVRALWTSHGLSK